MAKPTTVRWVGIDEAGYGPNLGPMVMTAVVAEGPAERAPDLWTDLADRVTRAGGHQDRLWVDDSKAIHRGGKGRDRLEAACLALLAATGRPLANSFGALLLALEAGSLVDAELAHWLDAGDPPWPTEPARATALRCRAHGSFDGAPWKIVRTQAVVVGPARFNAGLGNGRTKAQVHFSAFAALLSTVWDQAQDGVTTFVRSDKHGGRHFYYELLMDLFPDAWIDRGPEGPELSQYTVRSGSRRLELSLAPRADAGDGLVALASIVSKTVRESWMDAFNAHWLARLPGLRPTAGYPVDASRFRAVIEPECLARGLEPSLWWREK